MKHFYSKLILLLFFTFTLNSFLFGQYILVDTSLSKEELIDKFIGTNTGCITISNINISGYNRSYDEISYGYFTKGTSNFDLSEGIILSTGKAKAAEGPNSSLQDFWGSNWGGDQDLIDILIKSNLPHDNILNATSLEFDFVSNLTTNQISFEYMFLSEEYQSSNCQYSDAFAFLIKKADNSEPYQNIALIPNTTIPVTSLTINGARDCPRNISYFGGFNSANSPTNFNGQTKVLKANAQIEAGTPVDLAYSNTMWMLGLPTRRFRVAPSNSRRNIAMSLTWTDNRNTPGLRSTKCATLPSPHCSSRL